MRIAIIGAGPAGLFTGAALARRGHGVLVVDRDGGPNADGSWARRGVMQFHHAHAFRPNVAAALQAELPEAYTAWLDVGADATEVQLGPGATVTMVRSRRVTFETALRQVALVEPGVTFRRGHVDEVLLEDTRSVGIRVDSEPIDADMVIDASGRSGRVTRPLRAAATIGGECGIAYVNRQYQLRPGAQEGPLVNPIAFEASCDGYGVLVFPHEKGIFSVVILRPTDAPALTVLRHDAAFAAATAAIPGLSEWTDPDRSQPRTPVLSGGTLTNTYRGQRGPDGELAARGLVFLGDAVATTTPNFGRGLTTTLWQCRELIRLIDEHGADQDSIAAEFDQWCDAEMKPWVLDHVQMDTSQRQRWQGADVDLSEPLPSDLILQAAQVDPSIGAVIGPYLAMVARPDSLRVAEAAARAVYRSGWRPSPSPGPSRDELAEIADRALAAGNP